MICLSLRISWKCVFCLAAVAIVTSLAINARFLIDQWDMHFSPVKGIKFNAWPSQATTPSLDNEEEPAALSASAAPAAAQAAPVSRSSNCSGSAGCHGNRSGMIPYILHQTWISDTIPSTYVPYARSWAAHKPPLAYFYWTDESSLAFVAKHYPGLLATFRGYRAHLNRADAIRYMLLHHYGGVYADMDMMRLRDLTPMLNSSRELCYLSQERYELTRLYWGLNSSVMNALMMSAPGHQFMDYVVKALPRYAHHSPSVMESTGPFFLQNVLSEYQRSSPCSLASPMCRCVAADPYLFMPQVDPIRIPLFRGACRSLQQLKPLSRDACGMLDRLHWRNDLQFIARRSYTHHGFLHYGFKNQSLRFSAVADIGRVRPGRLTFGRDFQ